ncbi:MAG: hypothetical protein Q7J82_00795 [Coriobacteriia bacterium]|nr:hypothetical protein [Coriobacteriia bacterium]
MEVVVVILAGVLGMSLGIWGGFKLGERVRDERPWRFWALNGGTVIVSLVALLLAGFSQQLWIWSGVMATFAGMLTGLKYGYGKSVGLWRVHDRLMHVDKTMRD